jgi:hypothetical protein
LDGDFGDREPDIAGSGKGIDSDKLIWNNTLFVWEIKRLNLKRKDDAVDPGTRRQGWLSNLEGIG